MTPTRSLRSVDYGLLFGTRSVRLFAYGFLSVALALYLVAAGLSEAQVGWLLSLTLLGDTAVSLWLTTHADRLGRRRMLLAGAGLMVLAGVVFAATRDFWVLLAAAIVGVISPSGNEVGPFLAIEQAALAQTVPAEQRTATFARYNLAGSLATAAGALAGGALAQAGQGFGLTALASYRLIVWGYALAGGLLALLFTRLSPAIEAASEPAANGPGAWFGLAHSRPVVARLAGLFMLDAFAGGFVVQSLLAYWLYTRFNPDPAVLGVIFFGANLLAGLSALSAAWLARKIGLVNTMVFTHLPSNILLMLVPLMPTLPLALAVLLLRFSISQMDVPTRQSYVMAVVPPTERSAASGVTGVVRTIGAALAPVFAGSLLEQPSLLGVPFFIAGGLKIVYDLALYRGFRSLRPPEEV
ncbi:MAG: MFS transporter [Anaerolineales bacterium]|nr:MFS transporter [Anaerolineales bacterium]